MFTDSYDNVIGFVHVRDLLGPGVTNRSLPVGRIARAVKFLPISKTVLASLSEMRRERAHLAIVVDDYGGTAGIVTLEDLVEELIGDIRDEYDTEEGLATRLRGGEFEVDGLLNLDDFAEQTGIRLPEGPYETAAGYVLAVLGDLPSDGDSVRADGHTITVTELDGRRIARLRVAPTQSSENTQSAGNAENAVSTENTGSAANTVSTENTGSAANTVSTENPGSAANIENAASAADAANPSNGAVTPARLDSEKSQVEGG